jgi:metallo-beta-lactamase family protein
MEITFLGAAQEVTGSKYLIEDNHTKILVDCGLFQGNKQLKMRNWDLFPIDPSLISAIILTHAHIDHTGYIPVLVKNGFRGKIYCSKATYELTCILLVDSGLIQEEDAKKANQFGYSSHSPALPLYTARDARHALQYFHTVDYNVPIIIDKSFTITLIRAGHILGSSFVIVSNKNKILTFSGDLGRPHQLDMKPPTHLKQTDFLVIESTYGNRLHEQGNPIQLLGKIVNETVSAGGTLLIPSFAVGRAQIILYSLYQLKKNKAIPDIPIFLDSPMAINVTDLFCMFNDEHVFSSSLCKDIFNVATYTRTIQKSKKITQSASPAIIIAGSGMADGGRMMDHLKRYITENKNTIVFVGFQASGTRGRTLIDGAQEIKIQGKLYQVHAKIKTINTLSAHADYNEILEWLGYFEHPPKKVFVTHGEFAAAQSLKKKIEDRFGWSVVIPRYLDSFNLS